LNPSKDEEQD